MAPILTARQAEVLRSYAEAEATGLPPVVAMGINTLKGHAHGMAVWGINRVLRNLEIKGMVTVEPTGVAVTTEGHFWLFAEGLNKDPMR